MATNMAYSFDGVDDYIEVGVFEIGGAVTFSTWIKYESLNIGLGSSILEMVLQVVYFTNFENSPF